ncbi:hypothetical protein JCM3774_005219 [Rhodotorula dairenensis]
MKLFPSSLSSLAAVFGVTVISLVFVSDAVADGPPPLPIYGYGNYPCTKQVNGVLMPDQSQCAGRHQECVKQKSSSYYFCGIAGARCATADYQQCDSGACVDGICTGGLGDTLPTSQTCMSNIGLGAGTCGGPGADCTVPIQQYPGQPLNDQYDQLCLSNRCGRATGLNKCYNPVTVDGGDCSLDPERACTNGLVAHVNHATGEFDARCPTSYTACPLADGYECIDTSNSLEQCGGCGRTGVDCTALEGVLAVGCVSGTCEIWSCADGYEYQPRRRACVPA